MRKGTSIVYNIINQLGNIEYLKGINKININGNKMVLSSSNPTSGTGKEEIACESNGENLNVAFNSQYMVDILKNLETKEAIMSLNTSLSPVCINPVDDDSYTYIVTPVRVVF